MPTTATSSGSPAATSPPKMSSSSTSTTGSAQRSARVTSRWACSLNSSPVSGPPATTTDGASIWRSRSAAASAAVSPASSRAPA